ncbi:hypothetical protein AF60_08270 [Streptococcus uberis S6261]|nr:hypothetical protein AF63_05290 [Streptococcus uberis Ab71]KKF43438.1 hypothetical protein AF64_05335 [Streptococcus uberis C9359]KKF44434.1 hypothetical protein AF61_08075 [Streptococcus uberis EF20/0145]KKF48529.1 hypothetical protein AF59_08220 [Streptococcus uberis C5072]KKF49608.1 hypothetical protein AF62_05385 [Streptococcus uberis C8329]KKF50629.1 hypothetical protein AF60_08270 [Streptococcus uberis S6261]KKF53464.1 hypothetical protein AF65_05405 [Streptococcus uberis C5388]KKF5
MLVICTPFLSPIIALLKGNVKPRKNPLLFSKGLQTL